MRAERSSTLSGLVPHIMMPRSEDADDDAVDSCSGAGRPRAAPQHFLCWPSCGLGWSISMPHRSVSTSVPVTRSAT